MAFDPRFAKNGSVQRDFNFTNTQNQVSLTIPRVHISTFPVKIAGSLAYDLDTETVWYSNGIVWLPIDASSAGEIVEEIIIYVNAETGNDANKGLFPTDPVKTIQKGLDILGTYFAHNGIIQLQGADPFDLGTDGELNFFPATTFIGSITIRGTMSDIIEDTVASIPSPSGIGPFDTWTIVNGVNGGYTASAYIASFIRNDTQDRVYVVSDNSASSVDTMTGVGNVAPNNKGDGWVVGESFTMFKVQNILTFSGELRIINPSNSIIFFEYLWLQPAPDASWIHPELPISTFRGCRMDANSDAAYVGSMYLEGCYGENIITPTVFSAIEQYSTKRFDSVWLRGTTMRFNNTCSAFYFNHTDGIDPDNAVTVESSDFQVFSFQILNGIGVRLLQVKGSSLFTMTAINLENSASTASPCSVLDISGNSLISTNGVRIRGNASPITSAIACGAACRLILGNENNTGILTYDVDIESTGDCYSAIGGSTLSIFIDTISMTTSSTDRSLVILEGGSTLNSRLNSGSHTYLQSVASSAPLFSLAESSILEFFRTGGTLNMFANSTDSIINLSQSTAVIRTANPGVANTNLINSNANGNGVIAAHGSRYDTQAGVAIVYSTRQTVGTNATINLQTNSNFTSSSALTDVGVGNINILLCGNVAAVPGPGPYSTSTNDYVLGPTQNCSATFG